uniref:GDNF/GAS1 domain-containing protein n=1 Tax=Neogobius melanostomus TaxID=47308 RepID=A0A8C6X0A1_9GOBI
MWLLTVMFVPLSSGEPAVARENNCLNAAKACNLNDTCKKYRSAYISPCTSRVSTAEVCNKRKCHKALRQFFDKVPPKHSYGMLFCSCPLRDQTACSERRRQTIVPFSLSSSPCSPPPPVNVSVCAGRLNLFTPLLPPICQREFSAADRPFLCTAAHSHPPPPPHSGPGAAPLTKPGLQLPAHLSEPFGAQKSTVMTPNYLRSPKISVSPYCNCSNSGNNKDECDKFTEFFTENTCLRKSSIHAGPPLPLLFPQSTSSLYTPADPPALPVNVSDDAQRLEEVNVEGVVRVPSEEQECADPGPVSQSQGELRDSADENSDYLDEDMSGEDFLSSSQKRRSIDNSQGSDKSVKVRSKKDSHCPSADTFFFCSGVDSTQLLVLNSFCRTRRE